MSKDTTKSPISKSGVGRVLQPRSSDMSSPTAMVTYLSQGDLPRLPIPSLDETLKKFLEHLKALQTTDEQRQNAERVVDEFLKGDGPKLQELLLAYDREGQETGSVGSYVEEFWNDSYLAPDSSVVMNLNPFFVLEEGPDPKTARDQIRRAASLCFASAKFASQLKNESLRPDVFKGRALCMDQFKALFGSARVPAKPKDDIHIYEDSNHIAVLCRNQMYYFQALWPDGNVAVDEGDIVDILEAINAHTIESDPVEASLSALGVFTALPRNEWAKIRQELVETSSKNQESLQILDSALFVLVLDDFEPKSLEDMASNMLHGSYSVESTTNNNSNSNTNNNGEKEYEVPDYQTGSCCNRWYDKMQIIICKNGTAGINFEHSAIDGHTALRFVSDVYAETVLSFAQSITKMVHAHESIPNVIHSKVKRAAVTLDSAGRTTLDVFPKKIEFDVPTSIKDRIYHAETYLGDQIIGSDTEILEFKDYGKLFIVGKSLSPDSYVQMSMMLAYYKLYGRVVCAYEPVLTKSFFHGRTEAMRSATMEAKTFCETWCSRTASVEEKIQALRTATKVHSQYVRECAKGKGVDRHLFALKCIAEKNNWPKVPEFFQSEPWKMLNYTILSTSNCGNPALRLFGFGPVVPDGLGVGYIIKDNGLHYSVSSKHRQTKRYVNTLERTLQEMAEMLHPGASKVQPEIRASLATIPSHMIAYDSYGDIWGESAPLTPRAAKTTTTTTTTTKPVVSPIPTLDRPAIPETTESGTGTAAGTVPQSSSPIGEQPPQKSSIAARATSEPDTEGDYSIYGEPSGRPPSLQRGVSDGSRHFKGFNTQTSFAYRELSQKGAPLDMGKRQNNNAK